LIGYFKDIKSMLLACLDAATKRAAADADVKTIGDYIMIMENIKDEIISSVKNTSI